VLVAVAAVLTAVSGLDPAGIQRPIRAARRRGGAVLAARLPEKYACTSAAREAGVDVAGLLLFAAVSYLSLLARRNMALFALAGVPFVGQCASLLITRVPAAARRVADGAASTLTVGLSLALVAALWFVATNHYYRWSGDTREFGTGVYEVFFPIRASAFIAEHKLPPPIYNDDTTGGYLTYARPVPGGVYIDGRLEVYDADFYMRYQDALNNPVRWQAEADQRGIQTVILLHWWPIRLCRFLLADRRWALVYFDETVFVFLRREGNEALIAEAVAAFATLRPQIEERLLSPVSSWGWPVFRAMGLVRYALALGIMGNVDDAARFNERYLDLRPEPHEEARVALDLARYHAARGDTGLAHLYLRRAARAEPDNPDIARLTRYLDG